jgi:hypothetical protein
VTGSRAGCPQSLNARAWHPHRDSWRHPSDEVVSWDRFGKPPEWTNNPNVPKCSKPPTMIISLGPCCGEHPIKRMENLYLITQLILIFGNQLTPISSYISYVIYIQAESHPMTLRKRHSLRTWCFVLDPLVVQGLPQ